MTDKDIIKIIDEELKEWWDSGEWNDEDWIEWNAVDRFVRNVKKKIDERELDILRPKFLEMQSKGLI